MMKNADAESGLSAVGQCTAAVYGCLRQKMTKSSARDVTDGSSVTATQTTQVVREIKSHKGEIGEEMTVSGCRCRDAKKHTFLTHILGKRQRDRSDILRKFEITNNSEDELAVDLLSQTFGLTVDGEAYPGVSIRSPRFIYKEIRRFRQDVRHRDPARRNPQRLYLHGSAGRFPEPSHHLFPQSRHFWTGTRRSSLTSIVRTWKLHRSRWKHSSKSLPANGLCAVLPQIQKANGRQIQMPAVFLAQNKGNTAQSLPVSFARNSRKIRSIDLTHHAALQKKFSFYRTCT